MQGCQLGVDTKILVSTYPQIKNDLAGVQNLTNMSLSVQRLAIESFSFRGKNVRSLHVPGMGKYLVGIDVSRAIGYADDNNGKRATKRHVPQKYMMRFEDFMDTAERHVQSDVPQDDAILLKESGIYCFLLRCKMSKAKFFMESVVETVLPREVRKLASAIEEKDTTITLLTDDLRALEFTNEKHQQKILRRNKEIDGLIKNRNVTPSWIFWQRVVLHQKEWQRGPPILRYSMSI